MNDYQQQFIDCALANQALLFGEFQLKSGRLSPYFFNAGNFQSGSALATIGHCYARAIIESNIDYDVLFGPAYKAIPLVGSIAIALDALGCDKPYAFNRKEAKNHGEGGTIVGASIKHKKLLIVDDVITAGTAIRAVMNLLSAENASAVGVVVGLDRKERGASGHSAIDEVKREFKLPVLSIIDLNHIQQQLAKDSEKHLYLKQLQNYREQYGVE